MINAKRSFLIDISRLLVLDINLNVVEYLSRKDLQKTWPGRARQSEGYRKGQTLPLRCAGTGSKNSVDDSVFFFKCINQIKCANEPVCRGFLARFGPQSQ